jgi:chromosome segregation ATPase
MATLNQILEEQGKLIGEAKKNLEKTQKKPPSASDSIALKEATVAELKARVTSLTAAEADIVRQLDEQIAGYKKEIAVLEKQIEEEKKQKGVQLPRPRTRGRRAKS